MIFCARGVIVRPGVRESTQDVIEKHSFSPREFGL